MSFKVESSEIKTKTLLLTFFAITVFYFFEAAQMSYFNVLAPYFLQQGIYQQHDIAGLSAAYYYGDMVGLLPVGYALDRFPLRKTLLWAIVGSVISAFLLVISKSFYLEWLARFLCGFFGGTFSFLGGIRVLSTIFPQRFSYFMALFLSAGMLGGLVCQYPLLYMVNHLGTQGAMAIMVIFGLLVICINLLFLHPTSPIAPNHKSAKYSGSTLQMCAEILKNYRNWLDCFMVILLDTPVIVIGTLWGVVLLMNFYHFSDTKSAWMVMSMFAGLILGLPLFGALADRYHQSEWLIILGAGLSFIIMMGMVISHNAVLIAVLLFGLGLFSSCQTLGFSWLTKNMRPELIGRNSAFNSMLFMGANGGIKQLGAYLLSSTPLWSKGASAVNLLVLIAGAMLLATVYASLRKIVLNIER